MNQNPLIYIEGSKEQKIILIAKQFCLKESGKGFHLTISLHTLKEGNYILAFHQVPPFELLCELLFTLHTQLDERNRVFAYCSRSLHTGALPDKSMVYITPQQDLAAIDLEGNVYEEDIENGPYFFKQTVKRMDSPSIPKAEYSSQNKKATFLIVPKRTDKQGHLSAKIQSYLFGSKQHFAGCLPPIILLVLWGYSFSLAARTEDVFLTWHLGIFALIAGMLPVKIIQTIAHLFFSRNGYVFKVLAIFLITEILVYIPNYHLSRHIGEEQTVVEELYSHGRRNNLKGVVLRLTNNDKFDLQYGVRHLQPGDTCLIDLWKGVWGLKVCRGLKIDNKQIWKY